ncbi:MAG: hypothetical protein ACOYJ1_00695 [Peptococcales bacterium]|jgi:hypothetical protein
MSDKLYIYKAKITHELDEINPLQMEIRVIQFTCGNCCKKAIGFNAGKNKGGVLYHK